MDNNQILQFEPTKIKKEISRSIGTISGLESFWNKLTTGRSRGGIEASAAILVKLVFEF